MKKLIPLLSVLGLFAFPSPVHAVCPVCTVAVAAGLGVSRWIGIDDSVTGVWIGGLILSSGLWLADWIGKKGWRIPHKEITSILLMLLFVIPPLYWSHMIGLAGNTLWGIDKVLIGTIVGALVFVLGVGIDKWLRTMNEGKIYIYYQKVIVPVFLLTISSFVLYLLTI
ncbi:MAG: hypothetical protein NT149_00350 [Candidatus Gottesmanbacteria bacterium]|nr:hypothetical protein [Candidatus Gottesmanbacteria bacterium]